MAALRVSPDGKGAAAAGARDLARGANGVQHGPALTEPDEVGMHPGRSEAGIVRGRDDVAALQHFAQPLDRAEQDAGEGGRALVDHTSGWMCPGNNRSAPGRCWPGGYDNRAGDGDRLAAEASGAIEDAVSRRALGSTRDRLPVENGSAG